LVTISQGWEVVLEVGAGTGGVYLLRWYWWRINAWSEISAMATALAMTLALHRWDIFGGSAPVVFAKTTLATTAVTTAVWVTVTLLTPAEPAEVLLRFYMKVRPHAAGWRHIAMLAPDLPETQDLGKNLLAWVLGCAMVYAALFGIGKVCLGETAAGIALLAMSTACAVLLYRDISQRVTAEPMGGTVV
jgi:SSS family solute:Na+ symporter